MGTITLAIIILASSIIGLSVYLLLSKKISYKVFISITIGSLIGIGLIFLKRLSSLEKKAIGDIAISKSNDKIRSSVIKSAENQIKKNKDLINEIKKVLGDN